MKDLNQSILQDADKYFPVIDQSIGNIVREGEWVRPGTVPMFYPHFENTVNKILYVGLNPSLIQKMEELINAVYQYGELLNLSVLLSKNEQQRKDSIQKLIDFQEALKGKNQNLQQVSRYGYFTAISNLHNAVFENSDTGWEHYDILPYRSTYQKHITRIFNANSRANSKPLSEFFNACIARFIALVTNYKFRGIVICNARVSRILQDHQVLNLHEDPNGSSGNIILTKQLTGGGLKTTERELLIAEMRKKYL